MYFIDDVRGYTNFLIKHKLTPNQFYFLLLRNMSIVDSDTAVRATIDYIDSTGGFTIKELEDLESRGYLDNVNSPGDFDVIAYFATPKFYNELFVETDLAGEEFWKAYPDKIIINGAEVRAKTGDKEELTKLYAKKIKYNKNTHKKVLESLKKDIEEGLNMGIEKYIRSEQWTVKREYKGKSGYGENFIK